jgi:hypothetical protein
MGYQEDKEEEELNRLYPEGSLERRVLEYSRGTHEHGEVPKLLMIAFKLLMGISILMAFISLVAYLASH